LKLNNLWRRAPFFITIICLSVLLKLCLLWQNAIPFNADEAIVALMARHILQGERPVFFYGQAYMGSLDAFLVAGGFWLLGQRVWVIRLVQCLLYLGTIITTVAIVRSSLSFSKNGLVAASLLAIPTVNVTLYTTASLGGYGEALLLGNLILLASVEIYRQITSTSINRPKKLRRRVSVLMLIAGVTIGIGLWANGLTLVYSIPSTIFILWSTFQVCQQRISKKWLFFFICLFPLGFLIGSSPWWVYAFNRGWDRLIAELFGSAVAVERASWLSQSFTHLFSLIVLGGTVLFGLRPPWEVRWLAFPLLPLALLFWLAVIGFLFRQVIRREHQDRPIYLLFFSVLGVFVVGFLFTPFGVDPSGRYFLPLYIILAMAAGEMVGKFIHKILWQILLVGMVMLFNLWGTIECAIQNPPGLTTQFDQAVVIDHRYDQALVDFLKENQELRGYTNYWVSYPLAFESQEQIIFIPRLPYHPDLRYTLRDDRYPLYDDLVNQSQRVAYITSHTPELDEILRKNFQLYGISWLEVKIGDYQVFYDLSQPIRPEVIIPDGF